MQTVLIVIHLLIVLALVGVVLIQKSEGGGLGIGGGNSGLMSSRGQANALTRATSILAVAFFATSLALAVMATRGKVAPSSILDTAAPITAPVGPSGPQVPTSPAAPTGQGGGGILDDLQRLQPGANTAPTPPASTPPASTAPAAPASPAPAAPATNN